MIETIYIPLGGGSRWSNNELRYLLRSLCTNLRLDFRVVLYANPGCVPDWLTGCDVVEVERYYPEGIRDSDKMWFENYYDTCNKLREYVDSPDCPERFHYLYDDHLLIKPINDLNSIENVSLYAVNKNRWRVNPKNLSRHELTVVKALELAHRERHHNGLHNYETHAPKTYERDKLRRMFHLYDYHTMDIPYSIGTLYFNLYYPHPYKVIEESNGLIARFGMDDTGPHSYFNLNIREIMEATEDKTWINYADKALFMSNANKQQPLMGWITSLFPDKSRFEK